MIEEPVEKLNQMCVNIFIQSNICIVITLITFIKLKEVSESVVDTFETMVNTDCRVGFNRVGIDRSGN